MSPLDISLFCATTAFVILIGILVYRSASKHPLKETYEQWEDRNGW